MPSTMSGPQGMTGSRTHQTGPLPREALSLGWAALPPLLSTSEGVQWAEAA